MKTKIFVSSTSDLGQYRDIAKETIRDIGHDPVLWDEADFIEQEGTPEQQCLQNVEVCQVLLAIVGTTPGSPSSRKPWTVFHLEVIHAISNGMAVIICYTKSLGEAMRSNSPQVDPRISAFDQYLKNKHLLIHEIRDKDHFQAIIKNKLSESLRKSLEIQKEQILKPKKPGKTMPLLTSESKQIPKKLPTSSLAEYGQRFAKSSADKPRGVLETILQRSIDDSKTDNPLCQNQEPGSPSMSAIGNLLLLGNSSQRKVEPSVTPIDSSILMKALGNSYKGK